MKTFSVLALVLFAASIFGDGPESPSAPSCAKSAELLIINRIGSLNGLFDVLQLKMRAINGEEWREVSDYYIRPDSLAIPTSKNTLMTIRYEGPSRQEQILQLPPSKMERFFEALTIPKASIGNSFSFVSHVVGAKPDVEYFNWADWKANPNAKEIVPGQAVVMHSARLDAPVEMAIYLGQGLYATFTAGAAIVCDGRALKKINHSATIIPVEPKKSLDGGGVKVSAEDNPTREKNPLTWEAHDRLWQGRLFEFLSQTKIYSDKTVGEMLVDASKFPDQLISQKLGVLMTKQSRALPSLEHYIGSYERLMEAAVKRGEIDAADVFHPARAFRNWKGEEVYLRYGNEPPEGYFEIDPSIMPRAVVGRMLKQRLVPFSVSRGFHDGQHLEGFAAFPGKYTRPLARLIDTVASPQSKLPPAVRDRRVFFAYEALALVPKENSKKLLPLLAKPLRDTDELVTVEQVNLYYKKQSDRKVLKNAKKLLKELPFLLENYGGAARDLGVDWENSDVAVRESPNIMARRLQLMIDHREKRNLNQVDPHEESLVRFHGSRDAAIRHQLARLEVALKESTRLTAEEFIDELGKENIDRNSALFRMYVLSGISQRVDGVMNDGQAFIDVLY